MNASAETSPAAGQPRGAGVSVLLACFAETKRAGKIRRHLNEQIAQGDDAILDEVVVKINAKHKAQVHDPRRTLVGTLTPVLTWGIFGLLAGGLKSGVVWAVVGGICGGLYAYYFEHLATKDELKRIGSRLPAESSAILAYLRAADSQRILSSAASFEPAAASVAAVTADLSAQVYGEASADTAHDADLNMLLVRFAGEHAARQALEGSDSKDHKEPQVELFIEANEHGRRKVIAPKTGTAAFAKSDVVGWGVFGVAYGLIVGFTSGDDGVLGAIESGAVIGILWGIFGLFAGALYGMWAGRAVSARRLKGLGAFVPPDSSLVVAWADGSLSRETIERWAAKGSERLILHFNPVDHGAVLDV